MLAMGQPSPRWVALGQPERNAGACAAAAVRHGGWREKVGVRCAGEGGTPEAEPHLLDALAEYVQIGEQVADIDSPRELEVLKDHLLSEAEVVERLAELLDGEGEHAAQAAGALVARIDEKGRACLLTALFSSGGWCFEDAIGLM